MHNFSKLQLVSILIALVAIVVEASAFDPGRPENMINQEGQLLSIRISKGDPIRIFVVGREEAQLNLSDVSLTIRRLKPYPGKILKLDRQGNFFEVKDQKLFQQSTELEISASIKGKKESFKVDLEKKP